MAGRDFRVTASARGDRPVRTGRPESIDGTPGGALDAVRGSRSMIPGEAGLAGSLALRTAKLWLLVRLLGALLTAGGSSVNVALGEGVAGPTGGVSILSVPWPLPLCLVLLAVALLALDVRRRGERILLANLGFGMRHVLVVGVLTASTLEVLAGWALAAA